MASLNQGKGNMDFEKHPLLFLRQQEVGKSQKKKVFMSTSFSSHAIWFYFHLVIGFNFPVVFCLGGILSVTTLNLPKQKTKTFFLFFVSQISQFNLLYLAHVFPLHFPFSIIQNMNISAFLEAIVDFPFFDPHLKTSVDFLFVVYLV